MLLFQAVKKNSIDTLNFLKFRKKKSAKSCNLVKTKDEFREL